MEKVTDYILNVRSCVEHLMYPVSTAAIYIDEKQVHVCLPCDSYAHVLIL
jgi:hypothetical protein